MAGGHSVARMPIAHHLSVLNDKMSSRNALEPRLRPLGYYGFCSGFQEALAASAIAALSRDYTCELTACMLYTYALCPMPGLWCRELCIAPVRGRYIQSEPLIQQSLRDLMTTRTHPRHRPPPLHHHARRPHRRPRRRPHHRTRHPRRTPRATRRLPHHVHPAIRTPPRPRPRTPRLGTPPRRSVGSTFQSINGGGLWDRHPADRGGGGVVTPAFP